jgi:hypothetical protein
MVLVFFKGKIIVLKEPRCQDAKKPNKIQDTKTQISINGTKFKKAPTPLRYFSGGGLCLFFGIYLNLEV